MVGNEVMATISVAEIKMPVYPRSKSHTQPKMFVEHVNEEMGRWWNDSKRLWIFLQETFLGSSSFCGFPESHNM